MEVTKATLRIRDHIQFTVIDNEAVILDLNSGMYLGLDEVGTRVLQTISETGNIRRLCKLC
jgi:hypothetical protein